MVPFGGNIEEVRRGTHGIPQTDHRESSAEDSRRDVGDAWVGSSAGSGSDAVRDVLYREITGNHGTVGGVTTDNRSVYRGEGLRGGLTQEGGSVAPRGDREATSGHLSRNLTGI